MRGNDFMSWVLRSQFHGMLSNGMMLITVTGRKTGKNYTTPVGYYEEGDYLWVITSRDRHWWQNVKDGAEVSLLLKKKLVHGFAEAVLDSKAVENRMVGYVQHVPMAAKQFGIRIENNIANIEDVVRAARKRLFIRIKI
jgi:deazaflavin-dependent oxidoreductase (nitroreductase family)